jgi:soluble P-type ATPase
MALDVNIPGRGDFRLRHLVLDVNGTVAAGGQLIDGVRQTLHRLRAGSWQVHWITADTRGRQAALDAEMGWPAARVDAGDRAGESGQKAAFVRALGADSVVAVGNGANDVGMLREAALAIAVVGPEGLALDALMAADVVAPDIHAALEMLADPSRLVATLRR